MKRVRDYPNDVKLSITPLIDVTFLLLIFFMCAMKFKSLDYKVQAWLPKDRGPRIDSELFDEPERIRVRLRRETADSPTQVLLFTERMGHDGDGFLRLDESIRGILSRWTREEAPIGDIDAGPEVPHSDVMRALDALMLAGVDEVWFRGTKRRLE